MADLGLVYIPNAITEEQELKLFKYAESLPKEAYEVLSSRRVCQLGRAYDYKNHILRDAAATGEKQQPLPLPPWILALRPELKEMQ